MKNLSSVLKWFGVIVLGLHIIPILTILCVAVLGLLGEIFYNMDLFMYYVVYAITILSSLSVLHVVFKRFKADAKCNVGLRCAFVVNVLILICIICRILYSCISMFNENLELIESLDIVVLLGFCGIVICNELCKGTFKRYKERKKNFWGVVLSIFMGIAAVIIFYFVADHTNCSYSAIQDYMGDMPFGDIIPIRVNLLALLSLYLCMFVYNVYKFNKRDKVAQELPSVLTKVDNVAIEENCDLDIR